MIKRIFNALFDQTWTFVGLFVAWVVLEGSARTTVTYAIILGTLVDVTWKALQKDDND